MWSLYCSSATVLAIWDIWYQRKPVTIAHSSYWILLSSFSVSDAICLCVYVCVPTHINLSKCECPIQRMCDPHSTKGLSADFMFHSPPPTPTSAASKSQDKDVNVELWEECVTCHSLFFFFFFLVWSCDMIWYETHLNKVTATPTNWLTQTQLCLKHFIYGFC